MELIFVNSGRKPSSQRMRIIQLKMNTTDIENTEWKICLFSVCHSLLIELDKHTTRHALRLFNSIVYILSQFPIHENRELCKVENVIIFAHRKRFQTKNTIQKLKKYRNRLKV